MLGSYFLCIDLSFDKTQFTCNFVDLSCLAKKNLNGESKLGLMYQEVCYSETSNSIIKDMKIDSRNK